MLRLMVPLVTSVLVLSSCYLDNPTVREGTDAGASADGAADSAADTTTPPPDAAQVDAGPPLCTKVGGYGTVEVVVNDFIGALVADCRVSKFFTTLSAERVGHLHDCLVKQVAVVMRCPGIRYDIDSAGVECRDMKAAHKGISIHQADFDALVQDLVTVLARDGVSSNDIDLLAPSILALRDDIVTDSAPGSGREICDGGATDGAAPTDASKDQ